MSGPLSSRDREIMASITVLESILIGAGLVTEDEFEALKKRAMGHLDEAEQLRRDAAERLRPGISKVMGWTK